MSLAEIGLINQAEDLTAFFLIFPHFALAHCFYNMGQIVLLAEAYRLECEDNDDCGEFGDLFIPFNFRTFKF